MVIRWLGHSCFQLIESTGTTIVTDPYNSYIGEKLPPVSADAVTISHRHEDHNAIAEVEGSPVVLEKTGAFEIEGVHIFSITTYHDSKKGAVRGKNLVFKFRMDGVDVCHLGDIGEEISPLIAELITPINVLLIPVGGKYTINAKQAKEYVDLLMPDVVIPMHYASNDNPLGLDEIDNFIELFDESDVEYLDEIDYDRADFDDEKTRLVILRKHNG